MSGLVCGERRLDGQFATKGEAASSRCVSSDGFVVIDITGGTAVDKVRVRSDIS